MPYSKHVFDDAIEAIVRALEPRSVLDIGAGAGKYATLVRRACPEALITGVEIERDYIDRFDLTHKYDRILTADACSLMADVGADYDLVIFGDVIEHLRKSLGIDLLNFFVYRSKRIIVVFPLRFLQGAVDGRLSAAHISVWGRTDFRWCDNIYDERDGIAMVQIDGFLG